MKASGFASHVAQNRRRSVLIIGLYCLAFAPVGLLVMGIVPVLFGQSDHSLFVNPLLYVVTFLPLVLGVSLGLLAYHYYQLRSEIEEHLKIRPVTERQEPRFKRIGAEQAALQGLRNPSFGVIETPARNAISLGVTPGQRMIAVTRGLLNDLDDEEVAAVIAHELVHFRFGDARFLSLNHAMMRTAIALQVYNPLKIDLNMHTKIQVHFLIGVLLPIFLIVQAVGGMVTMAAWRAARFADRSVRSTRDLAADAEALRITHFPEALLSAIAKCDGRGYFRGAEKYEAMLFSGNPESEGGTHPSPKTRADAMHCVAAEMAMPGRQRRDTRSPERIPVFADRSSGGFGRKGTGAPALAMAGGGSFEQATARVDTLPREQGLWLLHARLFDPKAYRAWQRGMFDQMAWRASDKRNFLGATPLATLWFAGAMIASFGFHYAISDNPADMLDQMTGRVIFEGSDEAFASLFCAASDPECASRGTFEHRSSK